MPRPSDSDTLKDIIALTKYTMGFVPFTFIDFIDIILVAAISFRIYRANRPPRGTNAPYIISGIIMIYLMWVVVRTLNMELLSNILGQFVSVGVIALIIVFQPEIRRFLQMIGMRQKRFNFIARIFNRNDNTSVTIIAPIVQACREMSAHKTARATYGSSPKAVSPSMPKSRRRFSKISSSRTHRCTTAPSSSKATASSQPNASSP